MKIESINNRIFYHIDELFFNVVIGAIELPTKIIMIDTGTNLRKVKIFKETLEKQTGKKIEVVINTHYHGDHFIGNQFFKDARIISSEPTKTRIESNTKEWTSDDIKRHSKSIDDPLALEELVLTPPNEYFTGQIELEDEGVKVIVKQTGGHTDGSSYVYCPDYKVLFAGDNLFVTSYPWGGEESANPDDWMKAFKEYLSLSVEHIIPGHGPAINKEKLEYSLNYFKQVKDTMKQMKTKGKQEEEILEQCFNIEFYPIHPQNKGSVGGKQATLKKWYDYWVGEKEK
ncbi:MAG: MBL fold metallo-hydrolase [Candidatus Heimdallarchaeota archaeon]